MAQLFTDARRAAVRALLCASLPLLVFPSHARAALVCVGTAGQLNAAIIAAETNNESDDIRIRAGIYVAPIPDGFYYYPPSNDSDVQNVTVSGGWDAECGAMTDDATLSVLSGNLQTSVLRFRNANGTIAVRNLTITGGYTEGVAVGALDFGHVSGFGISVVVDRVILHHNETFAALNVMTQAPIRVVNSLFHSNLVVNSGAGGARIINENGFNTTYIYNNTFAFNRALHPGTVGGLLFENEGDAPSHIKSNIFWGNDNSDLGVIGNTASQNDCGYNDVGVWDDVIVCNGAGVVQVDPGFVDPAAGDFRLFADSPLIDIGCRPAQCADLPDIDLQGLGRPQGDGYDMGAYEGGYGLSDLIFADGFD